MPDASDLASGGATHDGCRPICWARAGSTSAPPNSIIGNRNLIRVGVAWAPKHVLPLWGTYEGFAGSCLGMDVTVNVTEVAG